MMINGTRFLDKVSNLLILNAIADKKGLSFVLFDQLILASTCPW